MSKTMFEDNCYEPIAEIYVTLTDEPTSDDIYCLCSRVFVEGAKKEEETLEDLEVEGEAVEEIAHTEHSAENTVRFCSSSTESQQTHTPKKTNEEVVSCYCSASHYSTDEHDSLRDGSVLHHSDSGADLSESSRDLDWERYWTLHGERLIWESWISKYGSYIDPSYLNSGYNSSQCPADGDEASFCIQSEKVPDLNRRTSFTGMLDGVKSANNKSTSLQSHQVSVEEEKLEDPINPQIVVEDVKNDTEDLLNRRLSDFSETGKSLSGKSEDSSNCDDHDKLRLSVFSRCSGSSAPLSATTDSMTNVTHITFSSSDSSYGVDDSSAKSSSVLSSSDSGSSVDQQWQHLWVDHFNEQYYYHFNKFIERHRSKKDGSEDIKSDSGFIVDESKFLNNLQIDTQHQESIDEVGSIETQDSVSQESDRSKPLSVSTKASSRREGSTKKHVQRPLSIGHVVQQLHAMSVEPSDRIQEEDESINSLSRPSTMESVRNINEGERLTECSNTANDDHVQDDQPKAADSSETNTVFQNSSGNVEKQDDNIKMDNKSCDNDNDLECSKDADMVVNPEEDLTSTRHGVKRSHESENHETCVEKIKGAYQLMGFMYDLENTKKIRKASVWYKKRFNQIRFQNRILRLQRPLNKHIYFDDDDENGESSQARNPSTEGNQAKNESGEYVNAADITDLQSQLEPSEHRKLEMEDFSEKDDSSDDQDVFFSAEEDNVLDTNQEKRESKLKILPKRRKKKQLKKKSVISYPQEMIDNPHIKKFWRRRYSLFSKFSEGIKMDAESWYSVTPEKIAVNIAERCRCDLVVDAFCGAGGNAIQLAFTCERVIAIDIDPHKIELARHNAQVYGVEDRIEFIVGDYLQVAPSLVADVVFLSPPWGGPMYKKQPVFPLSSLLPVSGHRLLEVTCDITENIAIYLPKNINTQELIECAGAGGSVEIVQNFLDRELVAVTAYFGELINPTE